MHTKTHFRITADDEVYRGSFEPYENLGHIGSILHPNNRSNTAREVRAWWNALLASNEPMEDYAPPRERTEKPRIRIRSTALVVASDIDGEVVADLLQALVRD